jgi:hypothetical protein
VEIQTTTVSAKLPSLSLLEGTASQSKGGVTIAIAPVQYQLQSNYASRERSIQPSFKEGILKPRGATGLIERTCIPTMKVVPDRLRFQVTVSNQMSRVFHGAGLVMQFNVRGQLIQTDVSLANS